MGRKRHAAHRRKPTRGQRRPSLTGTVRLTERGGTVQTAEGTFKLAGRSLREVMAGDTVVVSLHRGQHGERRAVVEGVTERAATSIVGTYDVAGPLGVIRPLDTRVQADFFMPPTDDSAQRAGVARGDVVQARIVSYPTRVESGVVTIERRIGAADASDVGIRCIMARYDLEDGYPARAEAAASQLALDIEQALADPVRRDMRDRFCCTIDPVDARDFDDAISLERTDDGGYLLGVHIADVSHYVAWDDAVDLEARRRTTSVYLADRVLPMLPEQLSNNLCSLVPDTDRLAMTVDITLDAGGRLRDAVMYPSVIRSRVRLSYDQADALLAGNVALDAAMSTPVGGAPLAEQVVRAAAAGVDLAAFLACADELAHARMRLRYERGAIDFNTVEVHAVLDDAGMPRELACRQRTAATDLIEEAMLLANECVAAKLAALDLPCAYRVHEPPVPEHLADAAHVLEELGAVSHREAGGIAAGSQAAMRAALAAHAHDGYGELVNALLLRAMQRAIYKPANEGHYALGADAYCHFTSPIRRYPDLVVHRVLKLRLARERLGARAARERAAALVGRGAEALDAVLPQVCRTSSERERMADAAAHASQKIKVAQYYADRVGERVAGTVSWIDSMGVFVRLDETHAEGMVHLRDLGGEWFDLDERALTLTGASTGRRITLGDRVIVEVTRVNTVRGHLDFRLIHIVGTLH